MLSDKQNWTFCHQRCIRERHENPQATMKEETLEIQLKQTDHKLKEVQFDQPNPLRREPHPIHISQSRFKGTLH